VLLEKCSKSESSVANQAFINCYLDTKTLKDLFGLGDPTLQAARPDYLRLGLYGTIGFMTETYGNRAIIGPLSTVLPQDIILLLLVPLQLQPQLQLPSLVSMVVQLLAVIRILSYVCLSSSQASWWRRPWWRPWWRSWW
jgi:hypothetical protein